MKNFLISNYPKKFYPKIKKLFNKGIRREQTVHSEFPFMILENEWYSTALFARNRHSVNKFYTQPISGHWIFSIGTWFHTQGFSVGSEKELLDRYLEVGIPTIAHELEGFFVIIIGNANLNEIIIITDIIGSCHCYFRLLRESVFISSSSLLLAGLDKYALDSVGCLEFLNTGIMYEDRTYYHEVRKLGPATVYTFSNGQLNSQYRYWETSNIIPESLSGERAVNTLFENLTRTVKKTGQTFSDPVCDLTGGYDSRALVMAFLNSRQSFSTVVTGDENHPDVKLSKRLANLANLPHIHINSSESESFNNLKQSLFLTDGEYDIFEYSRVMRTHESLSQQFDISINGSFAEVARGYWWELLFPNAGKQTKLDNKRLAELRYVAFPYDDSIYDDTNKIDLVSHLEQVIRKTNSGLSDLPNTMQMDNAYLYMRMQRWQGRIASSTNRIWPCLSPFMFRSVLETMLKTKVNDRRRGLLIRRMITKFNRQFSEIPLEHGYPPQPLNISNIMRFWPIPVYYSRKVIQRVLKNFKLNLKAKKESINDLPLRSKMWQSEELNHILKFQNLKSTPLIDLERFEHFLESSKQISFNYDTQWRRLVTLEFVLSTLETK